MLDLVFGYFEFVSIENEMLLWGLPLQTRTIITNSLDQCPAMSIPRSKTIHQPRGQIVFSAESMRFNGLYGAMKEAWPLAVSVSKAAQNVTTS
jgi:hypothetical protein